MDGSGTGSAGGGRMADRPGTGSAGGGRIVHGPGGGRMVRWPGGSGMVDVAVMLEAADGRPAGLTIRWGLHATPFGPALLGLAPRGICHLAFLADSGSGPAELATVRARWPGASLVEDPAGTLAASRRLFDHGADDGADDGAAAGAGAGAAAPVPVWVPGTAFQVMVWDALLDVGPGETTTYGRIAAALGRPHAARAVGGAVGANPVACLIPCHRVVRQDGAPGGYRWGPGRKIVLLARESALASGGPEAGAGARVSPAGS
jgi:AraC family transcriptional regulator, regulatory protein of adaptative response / methylated-DNA-[protein]-cysteine methyltransferase